MIISFSVKTHSRLARLLVINLCLAYKLMISQLVYLIRKSLQINLYSRHKPYQVWATYSPPKQQIERKRRINSAPPNHKIKLWNPHKYHNNYLVLPSLTIRVVFSSLLPLSRCSNRLKTTNHRWLFSNKRFLNQVSLFKRKNRALNRLDYQLRHLKKGHLGRNKNK